MISVPNDNNHNSVHFFKIKYFDYQYQYKLHKCYENPSQLALIWIINFDDETKNGLSVH